MKGCKSCKGKGWYFRDAQVIGKFIRVYGIEIPTYHNGTIKATCKRCHGKGQVMN